jgi:hypothetical protein
MNLVGNFALAWTAVVGAAGLLSVGIGVYWLFNKQARLRELAELRNKLDDMRVSDPEYGAVRALYTSMVIDAERWGFFAFDSGSDGHSGSADHGGDHTGGHHAGDGGSGSDSSSGGGADH